MLTRRSFLGDALRTLAVGVVAPSTLFHAGTGTDFFYADTRWDYRFVGSGAVVAAAEGQFNVRQSNF